MLADNFLRCDKAGSCMMGDQLLLGANGAGQRMMVDNLMKGANGEGQRMMFDSLAENRLGANGAGQRMMFDSLAENRLGANGAGQRWLFDSLATKDNAGFNVSVPGMGKIGANWADNWVTCDSSGYCMMNDRITDTVAPEATGTTLIVAKGAKAYTDERGNVIMGDELARRVFEYGTPASGRFSRH
jgi:hypothetical protein